MTAMTVGCNDNCRVKDDTK